MSQQPLFGPRRTSPAQRGRQAASVEASIRARQLVADVAAGLAEGTSGRLLAARLGRRPDSLARRMRSLGEHELARQIERTS